MAVPGKHQGLRWRRRALFVLLVLFGSAVHAQTWPQFRGPTGQGHSAEQDLPLEWSETRNIAWKAPVPGSGWSSPVIADGRVWLTTAINDRAGTSLRALAFDVQDGREILNTEVFRIDATQLLNPKNSFASPTAVVDGERVYVHFGADGTAALTTGGDVIWTTRLPYQSQHGNGGSPVLYDDLLIVSCDGADAAYVVALDARTGRIRWKTDRRSPWDQAYTTPLVIRVGGRDQVVSVGAHRAAAYEPRTGKEIWRVGYPGGFSNVPRPVYGHGLLYIATGFQQPSLLAVRPDGTGDVTKTHIAWRLDRGVPYTPSPLLVGDELFIVSDLGIVTCLDARTGETLWRERLPGNFSASPVLADERIYFQSEEGVTTVVAPGRAFRKLATSTLDGRMLASMGVSGGSFFIRSDRYLYRIAALPQQ
jgi:outer membrane protein assembly factor BamB